MAISQQLLAPRATNRLRTSLVAYWKMEEATGETRLDTLGRYNLTDNGNVLQGTGKIGYGAGFVSSDALTGSDAALLLPSATVAELTVAGWVTTSGATEWNGIVTRQDEGTSDRAWRVQWRRSTNTWYIYVYKDNGSDQVSRTLVSPVAADTTCFFAFRLTATEANLRVNTTDATALPLTETNPDCATPFTVGSWLTNGSPVSSMTGVVDELGLWARKLTDAELLTLYNAGQGLQYPFN